MKNSLPISFYLKYSLNSASKSRFLKRLMTAVCAGAVSFTAMCTGYLGSFSNAQNNLLKQISERELTVLNETFMLNPYDSHNKGMSREQMDKINGIEGVEAVAPVVSFVSPAISFNSLDSLNSTKLPEAPVFKLMNNQGLSKVVDFYSGDDTIPTFSIQSFPVENYYDARCSVLDTSVADGVYLTKGFSDKLGITEEMLDGLKINADIWVPVGIVESDAIDNPEEDATVIRVDNYYTKKINITFPVRGIFQLLDTDRVYGGSSIYVSSNDLISLIRENSGDAAAEVQQYAEEWNEFFLSNPDNHNFNYLAKDWTPNAFTVIVSDVSQVEQVKAELQDIDPNFTVVHEYQDFEAGIQIINNNRNILIYISLAVLAIVLLLIAFIYISLIDKRKFEFAVLRANGLTKKEVRKIVYSEMLVQFGLIFIVGIIFAATIYFVAGVWLGYPFRFDGMTILWLFIISLGSIVLPTVISLLFVNKFEPEEVIRGNNNLKKNSKKVN